MFNGSVGRQRAQRNTGVKTEDKTSMLKRAREERRDREVQRRRNDAARRVQSWQRGRSASWRRRSAARADFDRKVRGRPPNPASHTHTAHTHTHRSPTWASCALCWPPPGAR